MPHAMYTVFSGAPRGLVDQRPEALLAAGVLECRQYSVRPPRFKYHRTEAGTGLRPVPPFLNGSGTNWLENVPHTMEVVEHDCGHEAYAYRAGKACH